MAFKFFNIGKANEEIDSLQSQVAALTTENASLKENAPQIEAAAESLRLELSETKSKLVQAESDLSTAKASLVSMTSEKEKAASDLAAANAKLANPGEQIKQAAAAQAAAITASIGAAPLAGTTGQVQGGATISRADFDKMDHKARNEFFKSGGKLA